MSVFGIVLLLFAHKFLICSNHFYVDSAEIRPFRVSTNATKLFVGETFTMKCEMPAGFKHDDNLFIMYFDTDNHGWFVKYEIPATTAAQKEKKFYLEPNLAGYKEFSSIRPRNIDNTTNFEIDITTSQTVFSRNFYCLAYNGTNGIDSINKITISTSAAPSPPPSPSLISSVNNVQLNHSFTLTCSLQSNTFQSMPNQNYSVAFYSSRDGQLARYDVDVSGNSFFSYGEFEQALVHFGARSSFPNFDIVVTEKADLNQEVWCELTVDWRREKFESNKWSYKNLFLDFATTSSGAEHRGKCTTVNFANHTQVEYQIQFYSSLGPKAESLLGYFWVTPNQKTMFVYEHLPDQWRSIAHGASTAFPDFEIVAQTTVANQSLINGKTWWCALHIGAPGASYPLIKSQVKLFGNQT